MTPMPPPAAASIKHWRQCCRTLGVKTTYPNEDKEEPVPLHEEESAVSEEALDDDDTHD